MWILLVVACVLLVAGSVVYFRFRPRATPPTSAPLAELANIYSGEIRRIDGVETLFVRRPGLHVAVDAGYFAARPDPPFRGHLRVEDAETAEVSDDVRGLLRGLALWGPVRLTVSPGFLQLRASCDLDKLIGCGLQIAEALPRAESTFVVVETKRVLSGTACQVCGAPLEGEIVECSKCTTLHHRDCWEFNGRCSTFACGSLSSRKAVLRSEG